MASMNYSKETISVLMNMIDENKVDVNEGQYIEMCNAMKALFNNTSNVSTSQNSFNNEDPNHYDYYHDHDYHDQDYYDYYDDDYHFYDQDFYNDYPVPDLVPNVPVPDPVPNVPVPDDPVASKKFKVEQLQL